MSKYGLGRGLSSLFTAYEPAEKEEKIVKAPQRSGAESRISFLLWSPAVFRL